MPLTGSASVLKAAMKAAILAEPSIGAVNDSKLDKLCDAIATTVLAHIVANAVVATTGTATAQTGGIT